MAGNNLKQQENKRSRYRKQQILHIANPFGSPGGKWTWLVGEAGQVLS
jgi:hypothetical protein